mgnify:CR=1 FL=1
MSDAERATVLVVDDEEDVADAYAAQLEDRYDVITAYSGAEALDALDPSVDVVLLDRRMPEISGDEVLKTIRERDLKARVAMVTAVDPDFDIIEMPFDDYVVKPVVRTDLKETIDRLLKCAEYEKHVREYYALTTKYAALKASKPQPELEANDEFEELEAELEERRRLLDEAVAAFDNHDFDVVFRDFSSDRQAAINWD